MTPATRGGGDRRVGSAAGGAGGAQRAHPSAARQSVRTARARVWPTRPRRSRGCCIRTRSRRRAGTVPGSRTFRPAATRFGSRSTVSPRRRPRSISPPAQPGISRSRLQVSAVGESVVVTPAGRDLPRSRVTDSVTVVTGDDIAARQFETVAEAPGPLSVGDALTRRPRHQGSVDLSITRPRFPVSAAASSRGSASGHADAEEAIGRLMRNVLPPPGAGS